MIRGIISYFKQWYIILAFIGYFLLLTCEWFALGNGSTSFRMFNDTSGFRMAIMCLLSVFIAGQRVLRRHPFYSKDYHEWLALSPWRDGMPMPAGELHLGIPDVVFMAAVNMLFCFAIEAFSLLPLMFFISIYSFFCLVAFGVLCRYYLYFFLFLIAVPFWMPMTHTAWLVFMATAYIFVYLGNDWLLRNFPWRNADGSLKFLAKKYVTVTTDANGMTNVDLGTKHIQSAGWPHTLLMDVPKGPMIPAVDGLVASILAGWWVLSFCLRVNRYPTVNTVFVIMWGLIIASVVRASYYRKGVSSPLDIFGRMFNFRFFIPGHDIIYLPSLAVSLSAYVIYELLSASSITYVDEMYIYVASSMATVGLGVILLSPPTYRKWLLTGEYSSLGPPSLKANHQLGLKQI